MYTFIQYRVLVQKVMLIFSRSAVSDSFVTPWTLACQAPLSREFCGQEYWSGLPFPSPEALPDPGIKPDLLHCRQSLYHLSHQGRWEEKGTTEDEMVGWHHHLDGDEFV